MTNSTLPKINGDFKRKHILDAAQFSKIDVDIVLKKADEMKNNVLSQTGGDLLKHTIMAPLFFEPSSRTYGSFCAAMQRLGGNILPIPSMDTTSVSKGEAFKDTVQVFSSYGDILVIRHPIQGSVQEVATLTSIPIINAGDGIGEHPTQALLDIYTMREILGKTDSLHVVFFGELAHYRPVNSLAKLLALYPNVKISFISAPEASLNNTTRQYLKEKKVSFDESEDINMVIADADVLYVTRVKKEFMSEELYQKIHGKYVVDTKTTSRMKEKSIIMHPLPRIDEITTDVDADPRAQYFRSQVRNGVYVRMALLALVLGRA